MVEDPVSRSTRDYLAEYWGEEVWARMEHKLAESGMDLNQPFAPAPWEEAAQLIDPLIGLRDSERDGIKESCVRWPDELTVEWLRTNLGTGGAATESDLVEVGRIVEQDDFELDWKADEYVFGLHSALRQAWEGQRFLKAPRTTRAHPGKLGQNSTSYFYATGAAAEGWCVSLRLRKDEHPGLVALGTEMGELRGSRDDKVRKYFYNR